MSHPEAAERHAPIAAAIPALQHPLRSDPKPRPSSAGYDDHLQHLPSLRRRELPGGIVVDSYLDGVRQVRQ